MKPETILSACLKATYDAASGMSKNPVKTRRQQAAFRDRILRMFEQSELLVDRRTMQLEMAEQRIAELEAESENWRVSFHEAIIQLQAALEDIEKKDKELSDDPC